MALGWLVFLLLVSGNVVLGNSLNYSILQRCMKDVNTFLWELNQDKPKEYAALMYDSFGKMGSSVKDGNVNQPGSPQQCRSAIGPSFSTHYCQVFLKQGATQYFVGICVPDSCGEDDVKQLVHCDRLQLNQKSLLSPLPPILTNQSSWELIMTHCMADAVSLDASDITCMCVCCVMLAIPLVATLFTTLRRSEQSSTINPTIEFSHLNVYGSLKTNGLSSNEMNGSTLEEKGRIGPAGQCLSRRCVSSCFQAFSLQTTSKGVLSTASSAPCENYTSLNGIRVLSLLWIICGHSAQFPVINNLDNYKTWRKAVESSPVYVLTISGPVFLAVDTFLLLGGLLSARSLLSSIDKAEDNLSLGLVANYLFKRIKRIQPLHLFTVCLTISVISLVRWGPYWFPFVEMLTDCKAYWWANLLLVSNLLPVHEICIPWTWYLSLDFQCYATTPLLVYIYRLKRSVFAVVVGGILVSTTVASAAITACLHLPVFQPSTITSDNYVLHYYVKPYTRYGPFLIGILAGIYLTTKKDQLLKERWQAALGWLCCCSVMVLLIGLAYFLKDTPPYPSAAHALYQGLHRPVWALTVSWIILACEEGYGGFIKTFLSFGFWVPLSNISFACYLIHPIFIILYNGMQETPIHYTDINFMYLFLGHLMLTLAAGCALTVLVEKPYLFLKPKCI
ncbi:nose resistant to fluoxetine protein 6 [Poecilia reticulata]|uniref:Nose resistant to fluoxetine protein 6-like n=1 Tax=Poecilia reticulata TaxID=8081 RepID=A0A3P9PXN8_POERE|nr:PREDICTED: nose resistant to fluoxetine protein 6-like [Poecilia reticulata]